MYTRIKYVVAFTRIHQAVAIFNNAKLCNIFKKKWVLQKALRFLNYLLKNFCRFIRNSFPNLLFIDFTFTESHGTTENHNQIIFEHCRIMIISTLPDRDFHAKWSDEKTNETNSLRTFTHLEIFLKHFHLHSGKPSSTSFPGSFMAAAAGFAIVTKNLAEFSIRLLLQ